MATFSTIDQYLALQSSQAKAECEVLRQLIHATVPCLTEGVSYAMPAFYYQGKALVGFAAWASHIGFYPWSSQIVPLFADKLVGYKTSKGAIQLPLGQPIDSVLIRQIILCRLQLLEALPIRRKNT